MTVIALAGANQWIISAFSN